jgi:hypothetical protein
MSDRPKANIITFGGGIFLATVSVYMLMKIFRIGLILKTRVLFLDLYY